MGSLVQRKLIPMGAGGLVVVIPRAWARYYDLRAGDKVEVITNGKLVIRPKQKISRRQLKLKTGLK